MSAAATVRAVVALPADFRLADFLAFHRRDGQACAEQVDAAGIAKGIVHHGQAACVTLRFQGARAQVGLEIDAALPAAPLTSEALERLARHMLGLDQDIGNFEAAFSADPQVGPLLSRQAGLRIPLTPEPFEALAWAITGQQISVPSAVAIRRRLILACGLRHGSGLHCFPDAATVADLPLATLRTAGYSIAKAQTLHLAATAVADGSLPLARWQQQGPHAEAAGQLLALNGIGPWTVHYTLLRGLGWLDGSLHGDVAVRRSLMQLLGETTLPSAARAEHWLARFAPWRALVAAHLWAALAMVAPPSKDGLRRPGALVG